MTSTDRRTDQPAPALVNWAGNLSYSARSLAEPESLDELRRLVARSRRLRALGTRHSFSPIADTDGDLVAPRPAAPPGRARPGAPDGDGLGGAPLR